MKKKILTVFGTRPEAIKMAPIIMELRKYNELENIICVTAQHRQMLDQVLKIFNILPDIDLNIMEPNQTLSRIASKVFIEIDRLIKREKPDIVLIQGDTTSVMAAGLASFYNNVNVGHVEAGLRSFNIYYPFPEELNRRVVSLLAKYHFAPTNLAKNNLLKEGVNENSIYVTGNTIIDALFYILNRPVPSKAHNILSKVDSDLKIILLTAHRRENFGKRFENICYGIKKLVERNKDIAIIYPVHLNPNVKKPVYKILKDIDRIFLIDPVEYDVLVNLMSKSYLILTDSGGIQEEAPSLGKPVLILRTETERIEGIKSGVAKLIGPFENKIVKEVEKILRSEVEYKKMIRNINPYGDGNASKRIVKILVRDLFKK